MNLKRKKKAIKIFQEKKVFEKLKKMKSDSVTFGMIFGGLT